MKKPRKFTIITLFPEVVEPYLKSSMMWKAAKDGLVEFETLNFREFGHGVHKKVDDRIFGGGDGMLLMVDPLKKAIEKAKTSNPNAKVILLSPSETVWDEKLARSYAASDDDYILVAGHYEGFDARIEKYVDAKISIGPYILTGGELPALALVDSIVRLIPGVLGGETSAEIESYSDGRNLEYPQYTRPEVYDDESVPEVLLSGNHAEIAKWRAENSRKP
jgi:tRNA (guanine37-N1)-methyltransferase